MFTSIGEVETLEENNAVGDLNAIKLRTSGFESTQGELRTTNDERMGVNASFTQAHGIRCQTPSRLSMEFESHEPGFERPLSISSPLLVDQESTQGTTQGTAQGASQEVVPVIRRDSARSNLRARVELKWNFLPLGARPPNLDEVRDILNDYYVASDSVRRTINLAIVQVIPLTVMFFYSISGSQKERVTYLMMSFLGNILFVQPSNCLMAIFLDFYSSVQDFRLGGGF